jgi:serine phosphatase RsbU (regulator of sigma subunit)
VLAIESLNEHIARISAEHDFVTLALLVVDLDAGVVDIVDAGHGYIAAIAPDGSARMLKCDGGIPVGIDATFRYGRTRFPLDGIARIALFSDGVAEGNSPERELFGVERSLAALRSRADHAADIDALFDALNAHCADAPFERDDTTALAIALKR